MATNTPLFSFLIVNFRSASFLPACLSSIQNLKLSSPYECIIANNDAGEEHALQSLRKRFSFRLLSCSENRGFGFAVNRAAEASSGRILFLINPDARFLSGDLDQLALFFKESPSVGIVGAELLIEPETLQAWGSGDAITLFRLLQNHGIPRKEKKHRGIRTAAWASGAALAIPRSTFFAIHGFDERFFLYYEDIDLCARIRLFGKKCCIVPGIRVLHRGGGSTVERRSQKSAYYASQDRYFFLHRPRIERIFLKALRSMVRSS